MRSASLFPRGAFFKEQGMRFRYGRSLRCCCSWRFRCCKGYYKLIGLASALRIDPLQCLGEASLGLAIESGWANVQAMKLFAVSCVEIIVVHHLAIVCDVRCAYAIYHGKILGMDTCEGCCIQ